MVKHLIPTGGSRVLSPHVPLRIRQVNVMIGEQRQGYSHLKQILVLSSSSDKRQGYLRGLPVTDILDFRGLCETDVTYLTSCSLQKGCPEQVCTSI